MIRKLFNTDDKRRLVSNFFSLVVLRGFQFIIPLITLPYIVRTVGLENFGAINIALSLSVYFGAFIQFGFGITATREIARHRKDPKKLSEIYSCTVAASVILALVSAAVFFPIVISVDRFYDSFELYCSAFLLVVLQSLFPVWFFQGMEKMKYIAFLSFSTSLLYLIAIVLFIKEPSDYVLVPLMHAGAALFVLVLAISIVRHKFGIVYFAPRLQELKTAYYDGRHAAVTQFIPNLYTNSVIFLLGAFASQVSVGLFVSATKIIDAVGSLVYIFSHTFLPFLSRNISKHKVFQKIMLAMGFGIAISLAVFAELIVSFMYGTTADDAALYIRVLSMAIPLIFVQVTYGQNYLMLVGKEKVYRNIILSSSILSLLYSIVLIYLYGAWGAVFTLIFTRLMISFFTLKAFIRYAQPKK